MVIYVRRGRRRPRPRSCSRSTRSRSPASSRGERCARSAAVPTEVPAFRDRSGSCSPRRSAPSGRSSWCKRRGSNEIRALSVSGSTAAHMLPGAVTHRATRSERGASNGSSSSATSARCIATWSPGRRAPGASKRGCASSEYTGRSPFPSDRGGRNVRLRSTVGPRARVRSGRRLGGDRGRRLRGVRPAPSAAGEGPRERAEAALGPLSIPILVVGLNADRTTAARAASRGPSAAPVHGLNIASIAGNEVVESWPVPVPGRPRSHSTVLSRS